MITVLKGTSKSGKTTRILKDINQHLDRDEQPLLIVPTRYRRDTINLMISRERNGYTGKIIMTLNELVKQITNHPQAISKMPHQQISDFEAYLLIDFIIQEIKGELEYFGGSTSNSGIVKLLYSLITDLRASMVLHPQGAGVFQSVRAAYSPESDMHMKWNDIWKIYEEYEKRLNELELIDNYQLLKTATQLLEEQSVSLAAEYDALYIDGFFDFTHSQFSFLRAFIDSFLSESKEVIMSLPDSEFPVINETRDLLNSNFSITWVKLAGNSPFHLQASKLLEGKTVDAQQNVRITEIHAFGKYREIEQIANEICRLVREEKYKYEDIALIVRNSDSYRDIIHSIFHQMEIPYYQSRDDQLKTNPVIILIYNIFRHAMNGIDNSGIIGIARSGYIDNKWRKLSSINNTFTEYINGDAKTWLNHLKNKIKSLKLLRSRILSGEEDLSDMNTDPEIINYQLRKLEDMENTLSEFLQLIFTLKPENTYTIEDLINWFSRLINEFGIYRSLQNPNLRKSEHYLLLTRDFMAFRRLKETLTSMMKAVTVLGKSRFKPDELFEMFDNLISDVRYRYRYYPSNSIKILSPFDARETSFRAVFIPGLNENEFPGKTGISLADHGERKKINQMSSVMILENEERRVNLERMDFQVAITRTTERLYLCHTPFDETGHQILPSIFLEEIRNKMSNSSISYIPKKQVDELFSDNIFKIVPSQSWINIHHIKWLLMYDRSEIADHHIHSAINKYPFLRSTLKMSDYHNRITSNHLFYEENGENIKTTYPEYMGILSFEGGIEDRANQEWISKSLDEITFSASSLQMAGNCRYQFFIRYILNILEETIPKQEIEVRQRGTFYHMVLKSYLELTRNHHIGELPDGDVLDKSIHQVFHFLRDKTGNPELWEIEMKHFRKVLFQFVEWESKKLRDAVPEQFEYQFNDSRIEITPDQFIHIQGSVDRMDKYHSGNYRIIDYKSKNIKFIDTDKKIPFKHFQGYIYAKGVINEGLSVSGIAYASIENCELVEILPLTFHRTNSKYPNIQQFEDIWDIKGKEIDYLITLMKNGNFLCYNHPEHYEDAKNITDFYISMNAEKPFQLESNLRCNYCPYHSACLRKEKLTNKFDYS